MGTSTMSFKKIAALFLTASAFIAFADAAHANTSSAVNTTYIAGVASTCSISGTSGSVPLDGTVAGGYSGSGTYYVTCNDPSATVSLTNTGATYSGPNGNTVPNNVTANAEISSYGGDFYALGNGGSSSSISANGNITVTARLVPNPSTSIPVGYYTIPTTLTLTYN
jgi:hypothetical protein